MRPYLTALLFGVTFTAVGQLPFERQLNLPVEYANGRVTQLVAIEPGATVTLMDTEGPGAITHLWMTLGKNDGRRVVLRMYWDGADVPSVEAPLPDFFGVGHGHLQPDEYFASACLAVAPTNGYNAYFPMPFRERARVTVTNEQDVALAEGGGLYFQADYLSYEALSPEVPYFHAQWRREAPAARRSAPYTVMRALGKGFIAGVTMHVRADDPTDRWFHGGGDMIRLDATTNPVVLNGIGGEDFFSQSWGSSTFVSPQAGATSHRNNRISFYRFFIEGPPRFEHDASFSFGALENEITSVAYWYQTPPHVPFTILPPPAERAPHTDLPPGKYDLELASGDQINAAVIGPFAGDVDIPVPLDGMAEINFTMSLLTNYPRPFAMTIPTEDNRSVRWSRARTVLSWLDLDAIFKPKIPGIRNVQAMPGAFVYVYLRIESNAARTVPMAIAHDDALRVWLNGRDVDDAPTSGRFERRELPLQLTAGRNHLLMKVTNTWNTNWAAFVIALQFPEREGITIDPLLELPPALPLPPAGPPAPPAE